MSGPFSIIVAMNQSTRGIGMGGKIPWNVPEDMEYFKRTTIGNAKPINETDMNEHSNVKNGSLNFVIMGRTTAETLPRVLFNRINIVISTTLEKDKNQDKFRFYTFNFCSSLDEALERIERYKKTAEGKRLCADSQTFVIGGTKLYDEALQHNKLESIYLTDILFKEEDKNTIENYDRFFPLFDLSTTFRRHVVDGIFMTEKYSITFYKYNRIGNITLSNEIQYYNSRKNEYEYLGLLEKVRSSGDISSNRTGIDTISLFGPQIEFDLSQSFPLLTTKRMGLKTIFEELMWFLRGQTNNKILQNKKVHIWDGNSTPEYMATRGLSHYPPGELGPIYGAQWRNFGGDHDFKVDRHIASELESSNGVDQILNLINEIKTNPTSRRLIVSAWNPQKINKMALPPCHFSMQFNVRTFSTCYKDDIQIDQKSYLDCKLHIRSNDLFLGAPFNIASYSMLVYMISSMTGHTPGRLVYSIGDAHIYVNHINQVKEQIERAVRSPPRLIVKNVRKKIEDFEFSDFELIGYEPHSAIKGEMAV